MSPKSSVTISTISFSARIEEIFEKLLSLSSRLRIISGRVSGSTWIINPPTF